MATQLEELKSTLESMQVDLPDSIKDCSDDNLDPALLRRYQDARDLYLRRHVQSLFLAHIATYDGHSIQEIPDRPTEEDEEDMREQLNQLHGQVSEAAQALQQQSLELQQKHSTFCLRRDELKKMVEDMEEEFNKNKEGNNNESTAVEEEEDEDLDDAVDEEEERLLKLQQRKAQLQVQLQKMKHETAALQAKTEQTEACVSKLLNGEEIPSSPTALQTEAAEMHEKIEKLKEIRDFYDGLRGVMEQLNALQILEVTNNTSEKLNSTDQPGEDVTIRVRALEKHDIEITLRPTGSGNPGELRVAQAKFLTSTVVRAPVDDASANSNDNKVLKLTIPPLDDLVKLCAMFPTGEDLRFLTRETIARIRTIEARVVELAVLHNNVLTRIASCQPNPDGFGGEEQEVVCSLKECITVVLRLTADCPNVPGSVYISQIVGVAGWEDETVEEIRENVSKQAFQTPWSLIQAIQNEIGRLLKDEGLKLPGTPALPLRKKT